jgi:pilus assembly protein Flp/PilA
MKQLSKRAVRRVLKFLKREDGPTAVEYAVMLMLIVVVCIASITALGKNTNATFSFVGSTIGNTH